MSIVYDILFTLFAFFYFPYLIARGKWHSGFKMRFGCFSPQLIKTLEGKKCIWIHAVSVGEVLAVADLVRQLRETLPHDTIVCSTVTKTGNKIASETLGGSCTIIYAPLDFSWIVRKFFSIIRPRIYIAAETEIWPNLYRILHINNVPIIQINGRVSDNAFRGYKRIRFLMKPILSCVDLFYMQSSNDADRIKELGAISEHVHVAGNLKFDNTPRLVKVRKEDLGFHGNEDLLIAGSTHPGEEDILIRMYGTLEKEFSNLRLVIVPRHIERAEEIIKRAGENGHTAVRFSQIQENTKNKKVITVVDTMGHLRTLYSLAKIVFIGKTLTVGGGQNMIESACFGKPTIVGPLTQNFKDVVNIFVKSDALIQIYNPDELLDATRNLLTDPKRAEKIGRAAQQTVINHQGATLKTIEAITRLLERSHK